ncbi:hypothetical protein ACFW5K_19835 [Streptomyces albidoflavus]|uniref:hypothetical protein n=1 Tax=Streptomyces albidoflavus TaxID=1886 RepID=UPI0004C976F8|nr:hypothetical protein [Streptomyces albidoflavus]
MSAFDLDTWISEAKREPFRFTLGGAAYSMVASAELDKSLLTAVNLDAPSASDIQTLLRAGLGNQWEEFSAAPAPLAALGELFKRWQEHEGLPLGESDASSDS